MKNIFKKSKTVDYDLDELVDYEEDYVLSYTEKGKISRPSMPVNMSMIRSVILEQHCQITKPDEVTWFEEGLKWLAQQQYQNTNEYSYFIEEEQTSYKDEKRRMFLYDIEDLERACEAYFGIPLHLCENHWAAEYLMQQVSKGSVLRRMKIKSNTSFNRFKSTFKRLLCCCIS